MIVNTYTTIAYKCAACGNVEFFAISLFKLLHSDQILLTCKNCNHSKIKVCKDDTQNLRFNIPCIGCSHTHNFILTRREALSKSLKTFSCPNTGVKLCIIGNDQFVRERLDKYEKEMDNIVNMFDYEDYFINTQVMYKTVNIIHDIAEQGNLTCSCGKHDIEILLLSNKIYLKCLHCASTETIDAASNEDLKKAMNLIEIYLKKSTSKLRKLKNLKK